MPRYKVIFSNKNSELNENSIEYFNKNLHNLNASNMFFDFVIAYPNESEKYKAMGIKSFPVIIHGQTMATGMNKMLEFISYQLDLLEQQINNESFQQPQRKPPHPPPQPKSDTDEIDDFWKDTMGDVTINEAGSIEEDDEENADMTLQQKMNDLYKQRDSNIQASKGIHKKNKEAPPKQKPNNIKVNEDERPSDTLKNMKSGDMDDQLMAQFFENQEESM